MDQMISCLDGTCNPLWRVLAAIAAAMLFGMAYDQVVGWLERNGHDRGYTAFLVVGGVVVTLLLGIPLVGLGATLWTFVMFAASGIFMVLGSWARSAKLRKADEEGAKKLAREALDDQTVNERVCDAYGDQPGKVG